MLEELIEDGTRLSVSLQLDDDPDALLVRLIPEIGNALNVFGLHQLRDSFQQGIGMDLVRQLGDNNRVPTTPDLFDEVTARMTTRPRPVP